MPHSDPVDKDVRENVARAIGETIYTDGYKQFFSRKPDLIELAETFQAWRLDAAAIAEYSSAGKDLLELAKPESLWHQIDIDGKTKAFVRSSLPSQDSPQSDLYQVQVSPIAESIDHAIGWIDDPKEKDSLARVLPEAPLVRVLIVTPNRVHALWLIDESKRTSQVLILNSGFRSTMLKPDHIYSSSEFLEALSNRQEVFGIA